jgi:L-alanine-DL-glutamate epimerase-like enolase superfamily enzyme
MKFTDLRTVIVGNPWKNWLFVVLETDEGVQGLGEATSGLSTRPIDGAGGAEAVRDRRGSVAHPGALGPDGARLVPAD